MYLDRCFTLAVRKTQKVQDLCWQSVSDIVDKIAPERWNHVSSSDNPADCASCSILPSEIVEHDLWWNGPLWLRCESACWPKWRPNSLELPTEEEKEICLESVSIPGEPVILFDRYSSLSRILRIVACILHFVNNCRSSIRCQAAERAP